MNFLWEGLNPIYLFTGIVLAAYLHIVGLAANKKIGTTIPTILMGLLTSLVISAPLMLGVHWGFLTNYKIQYITITILIFIFSLHTVIKNAISIKINKMIIISTITIYIFSLFSQRNFIWVGSDYWLYGQWFESGGAFISNNTPHDNDPHYMFTTLYRWFGSFSGMLIGGTVRTSPPTTHYAYQSMTSFVWVMTVMQLLMTLVPKIKVKVLITSVIISSLFLYTFSTGYYGSFSLFFIFIIMITSSDNNKINTLFATGSFIFMASSVIVMLPMVIITWWTLNYKGKVVDDKVLNFSPLIVTIIAFIIVFINATTLSDPINEYYLTKMSLATMSFISLPIICILSKRKIKEVILINSLFALMANLTLNNNWNVYGIEYLPNVVMHRYLQSFLFGELHNYSIILLTFPWAMHLLYEHFKTKKDLK